MAGRPKKNPDEKLGKPIPVKFSNLDRARIKEEAAKQRMLVAPFIRKVVLDSLNGRK